MCWAFAFFVLASCFTVVATGETDKLSNAVAAAGERAVSLGLMLCGTMMIWNGLGAILRATGDDVRLGRLLRRMLAPLFPGVGDDAAWNAVGMNLSANILGMGNAATPYGMEAAGQLTRPENEGGMRLLALLLVLNNSGLQLIPTTVLALRASAGSSAPSSFWGAAFVSSGAATVAAVLMMLLIWKGESVWSGFRPSSWQRYRG